MDSRWGRGSTRSERNSTDSVALVDSNLLAYAFDESEPEKRAACRRLVERCWKGEERYAVSSQNLAEFYVIATEKVENPVPLQVAERFVSLIVEFEGWAVLGIDGEAVERAIEMSREYGAPTGTVRSLRSWRRMGSGGYSPRTRATSTGYLGYAR